MKQDLKTILPNIRDSFEVDQNLKIDELTKENAHLQIQLNKYKKACYLKELRVKKPIRIDKNTVERRIEKLNYKIEQLRTHIKAQEVKLQNQKTQNQRLKKAQHVVNLELKFLKERIKQKHGRGGYLALTKHIECPTTMVIENEEEFLSYEKS